MQAMRRGKRWRISTDYHKPSWFRDFARPRCAQKMSSVMEDRTSPGPKALGARPASAASVPGARAPRR